MAESSMTVLVVDDLEDNREILGRILVRKQFNVEYACNGLEAIEAAKIFNPELILMDINMPELDGYEACKAIKSTPELSEVPIIFISANNDTVDRLEAFLSGGVDYISKPFDPREVIARVNTHIELRRAKAELQQKNEALKAAISRQQDLEAMRDNLTSMIVHDMRAPLSIVAMSIELLSDVVQLHGDDESVSDLECAKVNTARVLDMAEGILALRKLESESVPLLITNVDLQALVQNAIKIIEPLAQEHQVVVPESGSCFVDCDKDYLQRVFVNLCTNAIKAMDEPGKLEVALTECETHIFIRFSDSGVGIPENQQSTIFNSYTRGDASGTRKIGSIGLGLSFCKLAVEAHGGTISVESRQGKGSAFTVNLPKKRITETSGSA